MSAVRLATGGFIDRALPLRFEFDGRRHVGHAGDTLASALLANGVAVVGRSFKLHRPRGLLGAGVEEPNAIVEVRRGSIVEPNLRATEVDLYDGLRARAVNCWPTARHDVGALLRPFERFLPAGFYYKTFMWPGWHWFEPAIRRAAGLGKVSGTIDDARYESRYAHCDVLVVGGGVAGLGAALEAARDGARVILCEQHSRYGGRARWDAETLDDQPGATWIATALAALRRHPDVLLLERTTALGYFDHDALALLERVTAHLGPAAPRHLPRERLWQVRAGRVVLATGALERPLVFPGNDRPGVMLAGAVRQYLGDYAVRAGRRAVVFTNNDDAYRTAHRLLDAGGEIAAVVDVRATPGPIADAVQARAVRVMRGAVVVGTHGRPALECVRVRDAAGTESELRADLLAVSGGFDPDTHLWTQSGGSLRWDGQRAQFASAQAQQNVELVGAARATSEVGSAGSIQALWRVDAPGKAFVDFQNDVTVADIELAARENYTSIEHLKRYTTLGMAPDQGKTANVNALALLGELTQRTPGEVGTIRARFPYTPVAFAALAGRARGQLFRPWRRLPAHDLHVAAQAEFEEFGGWQRPVCYRRRGETTPEAVRREALAVREVVGLFDASPLGKIEVVGPDATTFLDRIYANVMSTLGVGRVRYGLMLNELGVIIDDGVAARLAPDRFLVGTTSAGAQRIAAWFEEWLQGEWSNLEVIVAPVTTNWAVLTLTGPRARAVLAGAGVDFAIDAAAFPHMSVRTGQVAGLAARVSRVSFTGEVAFEVSVAATAVADLWHAFTAAGAPHGLTPVGVEAWTLLRAEKGYLHVGGDTDGTTTALDVGWGPVLERADDFIGKRALRLPAHQQPDRLQFVGFEPEAGVALRAGMHVQGLARATGSDGYITAAHYSPTLARWVALGMLRGGRARLGEQVRVLNGRGHAHARVIAPGVYDRTGARLRA